MELITDYIQMTLGTESLQFKALERFAQKKGCTTTRAAVLAMINDLPEYEEVAKEQSIREEQKESSVKCKCNDSDSTESSQEEIEAANV